MSKVAILVDGGFYQKRARFLFGSKKPIARADELISYCHRHVKEPDELYRIMYYDCPPSEGTVYHPLLQANIDLKNQPQYQWSKKFLKAIVSKRKVASRLGELSDTVACYTLKSEIIKCLCNKTITVDDLKAQDFHLNLQQKGVDIRICLDITSMAEKRLVDRIILISGDSDFVPVAKHARREGVDFILDPMWHSIKPSLSEHIDGLRSCTKKPNGSNSDVLSVYPDGIIGFKPPME